MDNLKLIHSPDERGWYWEEQGGDWAKSRLYSSEAIALYAKKCNRVRLKSSKPMSHTEYLSTYFASKGS